MHARIVGIEYFLPAGTLTTGELSSLFPEWSVESIDSKTGIQCRRLAAEDECASDLAFAAATKLFESGICNAKEIDFLLLCTQSPDYKLPTTACLLQERLKVPMSAGCLDYNLGCSGYVYGLGLAEGLISSGQACKMLLITSETYSKYIADNDKSSRTIFGDGAAATFLTCQPGETAFIGPFVYGTDGSGARDLILPGSGARSTFAGENNVHVPQPSLSRDKRLYMSGASVFSFAVATIPRCVEALLKKARLHLDDIDLFVFHQASQFLLEELRRLLEIPTGKFQVTLAHCGNTVSSTIPIALKHASLEGRLAKGSRVMLVGFGVGYSWGGTIIRWDGD
jgi:3-oxoacyl-[acyl-carrier-protein] synthase-3